MPLNALPRALLLVLLGMCGVQQASGTEWGEFAGLSRYAEDNQNLLSVPQDPDRIVFFGDSITEMWKLIRPEFFENPHYVNRGIGGQTTPQMLLRFPRDVVALQPKAVVILAGINDIAGNTGDAEVNDIFGFISAMSALARESGMQVILCSVLPAIDFPWSPGRGPAQKVVALNALLQEHASAQGYGYIDYYTPLEDGHGGLKVPEFTSADDLVHPNAAAYSIMERLVETALDNL